VAADVVVVGDTGSTDGTVKALRQGGVVIHNLAIRPWRFDDARNAVLALVPADVDVCIALDFDEELSPGWRDALERDWTSRTTLGPCRRVTTHPQGIPPMVEANVAKIHSRFGYRWTSLCHESLVADRLAQPIETILPRLEIHRRLEASKIAPETYLSMLEAAVAEAPDDTDGLFRLGQQYALLKNWTAAEPMLRRFLLLAGERSPQSRATAWRALANCHTEKGNPRAAIGCLHEGLRIAPGHRDLWLDLAELNASSENWSASIDASRQGLALPLLGNATGNEPRHAGGRPFHQASLVASQLGLAREALALEGEACAKEPAHQDYRERLLALEASEVGRKRAHLHE
jgi:tetratricopeptide (TPR) repeat protein